MPGGGKIGGLGLAPDGSEVVVAGAAGRLSLLELRSSGRELSFVDTGGNLHCCTSDGNLLVAGNGAGEVLFWDLRSQRGMPSLSLDESIEGPGPDGLYPALPVHPSPITAISVKWLSINNSRGAEGLHLITGHEDGNLNVFKAD